jgi:DNA polymerase-3 subunit delta
MAKSISTLENIDKYLSAESLLPIYFLAGKDKYSLEAAVDKIKTAVQPFIASDFDVEIFSLDKGVDFNTVLDSALAFPFGSEKKLIVARGFENIADKKKLLPYSKAPSDFTILVITHNAEIKGAKTQPFAELAARGYLFENRKLRPSELAEWIIVRAAAHGITISRDNAYMLMEFVGNEKSLLEMQMQKFAGFLNGSGEVTAELIENLSSITKEFSIFELQDAIGSGEKGKAMKICLNLLNSGMDILQINAMLIKFITTLAAAHEYKRKNISNEEAARNLQVSPYYYKKCAMSNYMLSERRLHRAAKALLNSELASKTSGIDRKTTAAMMIAEMMQ